MSKNKKKKKQEPRETIRLSGRNVYTDKNGRVIYYDWLTKQGYLIQKENEGRMTLFKNRFVIVLFAAILFAGTFLNWTQAVVAGVVMAVLIELYFRLSYLKKLEVVDDVDFQHRLTALQSILEHKSRTQIIALAALYLVFAVLVVLNAYLENYSMGLNILSGCLGVVGLYFSALHIYALIKMG